MTDKLKGMLLAAGAVVLIVLVGAAIAGATGGGESAKKQDAVQEGAAGDSGEAEENEGRDDADQGEKDEGSEDEATETDEGVSGSTADRARAAALEAVGGGMAAEVEQGDDGDNGYEVEVERRDGSSAEVRLDRDLKVVSVEKDD